MVHWAMIDPHARSILPKALLLVKILQGRDQFLQFAGDDRVQLVQRQVDAMIGDAVLWKIVGTDAVAAIAAPNQRAPLLGPGLMQLLLLPFVQAAAQDAHGAIVVLVLAAFVLALH